MHKDFDLRRTLFGVLSAALLIALSIAGMAVTVARFSDPLVVLHNNGTVELTGMSLGTGGDMQLLPAIPAGASYERVVQVLPGDELCLVYQPGGDQPMLDVVLDIDLDENGGADIHVCFDGSARVCPAQ